MSIYRLFEEIVDISLNQSRIEEITLREDFGDIPLIMDSFSARSLGNQHLPVQLTS